MDSLNELLALVPAPHQNSVVAEARSWTEVERQLCFQLPNDYKAICEIYGSGQFARYISILDLRRGDDFLLATGRVKALVQSQKAFPQFAPPFPIHPAEHGIFLLGQTEVNSGLYWRKTPQGESIILTDCDDTEFYLRYDMSLSNFLLNWFMGEIKPSHFPKPDEEDEEDRVDPENDRTFYAFN